MADKVAKIRFVRCPKCFKLLPEFAHVPMYQCGGCGAVLQAKNSNIISESTASPMISDNAILSNGSASRHESSLLSSKKRGEEHDAFHDHGSSSSNAEKNESSDREKHLALGRKQSIAELEVASDDEMLDSRSLDASSLDNGPGNCVREKYRTMSRRTVRHQWSSGSGSSQSDTIQGDEMCKQMRMASLGSESFYSMRSSIEPDKEGPYRSLSKSSSNSHKDAFERPYESTSTKLKSLNNRRSELQKLVEELKDQLGGLYEFKEKPKHQRHETCSHNSCCCSSKFSGSVRQKARPSKRFCRPVSGGAPFVTCYKCFEVLHMPADFLISARRLNKLKCGVCSEILALRFPAKAHEVPQASVDCRLEDPISFSDEYGNSLAESCSTESGPSRISNGKSENENDLGSPLHRLMGYPSARLLL